MEAEIVVLSSNSAKKGRQTPASTLEELDCSACALHGQLAACLLILSAQTDFKNGLLQAGEADERAAVGAGPPDAEHSLNPAARLHLGPHHRRMPQLHHPSAARYLRQMAILGLKQGLLVLQLIWF